MRLPPPQRPFLGHTGLQICGPSWRTAARSPVHPAALFACALFAVLSPAGGNTEQCLASLVLNPASSQQQQGSTAAALFTWHTDAQPSSGACADAQMSFGLCGSGRNSNTNLRRECLLARVPWQTPLSVVRCCFRCCVEYWQDALGLTDIDRYWWQSKQFSNIDFDPPGHVTGKIPSLDSIVLHYNSIRRFGLFMWGGRGVKGKRSKYNATHLVQGDNGGGGVVPIHAGSMSGKRSAWWVVGNVFDPETLDYVVTHPVSTLELSDTKVAPQAKLFDGRLQGFKNGGHFFTNNANGVTQHPVESVPAGYQDRKYLLRSL